MIGILRLWEQVQWFLLSDNEEDRALAPVRARHFVTVKRMTATEGGTMATNLDHFATSSQPNPVDETPKITTADRATDISSVSSNYEAAEPTSTTGADEVSFVTASDTRPSASNQNEHDMPKTVLRRPLPLIDEEPTFHSLDDTVMRPIPARPAVWSDELRRPRQEERPKTSRIPIVALVCVVAVISFVAGGVVARLSSQMPVLLAQKTEPSNSQASYEQEPREIVEETQSEPVEEPDATQQDEQSDSAPSSDMGYDTVSDTPDQTTTDTNDDNSWRWDLDEEGNESITYDPYTNQVTIDYEGYSFSMPIGELIGDGGDESTTYSPNSTDDSYLQNRTYDDSTGYNTQENRDWYEWNTPRSFGWS